LFKAARDYALMEDDPARKADEQVKESYSPGEYVILTLPGGRTAQPIGDLRYSFTGTDYYIYCVANDWDPDLFSDFNSDACVVIHSPTEFARRLSAAAAKLDDWYFHYNPVEYFDPYERRPHDRIDNVMSKDFRFAYQRETRFLWAGMGRSATGSIDLELGPLKDLRRAFSLTFRAGGMVLFIPWRGGAARRADMQSVGQQSDPLAPPAGRRCRFLFRELQLGASGDMKN
jgi:hypothetical protein